MHGRTCVQACKDNAVLTPLVRDRPPMVPCPRCGAEAGVACTLRSNRRQRLERFGPAHPSRLEVAA